MKYLIPALIELWFIKGKIQKPNTKIYTVVSATKKITMYFATDYDKNLVLEEQEKSF